MVKTKKNFKKPLAIFDIDGTIFRSSLLIELQLDLVKYGIFPSIAKKELENVYLAWLNRKGSYDKFINSVIASYGRRIKGCYAQDIKQVAQLVVKEHKQRVYRYTRDLIKQVRGKYLLVAISGSPLEIVKEFNRYWKFNAVFATQYEINKEKQYTGRVISTPIGSKKQIVSDFVKENRLNFARSIGVGDSESDISFLGLVDRPIAFNPNTKLFKAARRSGWTVIVERKDVVYSIKR